MRRATRPATFALLSAHVAHAFPYHRLQMLRRGQLLLLLLLASSCLFGCLATCSMLWRRLLVAVVLLTLAAVFAALLPDVGALKLRSDTRPFAVVVVGAGLAGLTAAADTIREAESNGIHVRVTVLEAQRRVGGRVLTDRSLGVPIELGAFFIHNRGDDSVAAAARRLGLATVPYNYSDGTYFDADGCAFSPAQFAAGRDAWETLIFDEFGEWRDRRLATANGERLDESFATTLDDLGSYDELCPAVRRMFDLFCFQHIVQDCQAPLQELSANRYDGEPETTTRQQGDVVVTAYDAVATDLKEAIERSAPRDRLRTGVTVRSITWARPSGFLAALADAAIDLLNTFGRDKMADAIECAAALVWRASQRIGAAATTLRAASTFPVANGENNNVDNSNEVLEADRVVIAVPLGVLKRPNAFVFDPPLPSFLSAAILDLGMSAVFKAALCWKPKDVFWPRNGPGSQSFHKFSSAAEQRGAPTLGRYGKGDHVEFINAHRVSGNGCLIAEVEGDTARFFSRLVAQHQESTPSASPPLRATHPVVARLMVHLCEMFAVPRVCSPFPSSIVCDPSHAPGHTNFSEASMRTSKAAPCGLPFPTRGFVFHDWTEDPFAHGGYSYWGVDSGSDDNAAFQFGVPHTLFFAGEHTIAAHHGSTSGALLSGAAAARQCVQSLRAEASIRDGLRVAATCGVLVLVSVLVRALFKVGRFGRGCAGRPSGSPTST